MRKVFYEHAQSVNGGSFNSWMTDELLEKMFEAGLHAHAAKD
jgi:hypothetical protein